MKPMISRVSTINGGMDRQGFDAQAVLSAAHLKKFRKDKLIAPFLIITYMLTVPVANFLIGHLGTVCIENGPCLIPVAPGILAPSGVLVIGVALLLRDLVQRRYGARWSLSCIAAGTALSFLIASPALALAS